MPAQAVDDRAELLLVVRQLLQGPGVAPGADDCDLVARLHLLFDELPERLLHEAHTLEGEAEVVNDECDGASRLLGAQRGGRDARGICRPRSRGGGEVLGGRAAQRNVGKVGDLLTLPVLDDFKILRREIDDLTAFFVYDDDIHMHQIRRNANHILLLSLIGLTLPRGGRRDYR